MSEKQMLQKLLFMTPKIKVELPLLMLLTNFLVRKKIFLKSTTTKTKQSTKKRQTSLFGVLFQQIFVKKFFIVEQVLAFHINKIFQIFGKRELKQKNYWMV